MDGDILNIDVSLFHGGYHGDLNETYYIGDKARADPDSVRVVEASRECLRLAIEACKPGVPLRTFGDIIETLLSPETGRMFQSPRDPSIEPGGSVGQIAYNSTDPECADGCILSGPQGRR